MTKTSYIIQLSSYKRLFKKLSNRRAIGEHTSTAVNCIPPAEVALNLAVGDFERNGDIYGHWGGMGVSREENESE